MIETPLAKKHWPTPRPTEHFSQQTIHVPWTLKGQHGNKDVTVEIPAIVHTDGKYAVHQALVPTKKGPVPGGKWIVSHPKSGAPIPGSGEFETQAAAEAYVLKQHHGELPT
jgi:hypothetical protein